MTDNAPKKLWLSAPDADGIHQVWFDPDEGGTAYIRADLCQKTDNAETFKGTVDDDTPLQAAAREAGWALMELVDTIDYRKRDQVSEIISNLGIALNASEQQEQSK